MSSAVVAVPSADTGASLTLVTVTVIVDESLVNVPSLAVNVKLSVPK